MSAPVQRSVQEIAREAELVAAIDRAIDGTNTPPYFNSLPKWNEARNELVQRLLKNLTPLLDRREGELAARIQQVKDLSRSLMKVIEENRELVAAKDADIADAHAHMDKLREHRNDLDAACHELEGKLREAEVARETTNAAMQEAQHYSALCEEEMSSAQLHSAQKKFRAARAQEAKP